MQIKKTCFHFLPDYASADSSAGYPPGGGNVKSTQNANIPIHMKYGSALNRHMPFPVAQVSTYEMTFELHLKSDMNSP